MTDWLIIADDLTGAADCGSAFVRHGHDAVVSWGDMDPDASIWAVDADSRHSPAGAAAACQVAALAAQWRPGMRFYKKIDSTLRGQPAAELAAQLSTWSAPSGRPAPLVIMAPAFPATGRVTVEGRILIHGRPLEQTPLWAREHTYASAFLPDVLASAGLAAETIGLEVIRAGCDGVLTRMKDAERRGVAAVVCDGTTDADLAIVAAASLQLGEAVWVGSAGLASALAAAVSVKAPSRPQVRWAGPILVVVGSLAETSRAQARALAESQRVKLLRVRPATLLDGPQGPGWDEVVTFLLDGLKRDDMLLEIDSSEIPDLARGAELAAKLADMVEPASTSIGAIVLTGGEIARAVLSRLGIRGMRLLDEVEPGVPLGSSLGALRIPVITKAGAFGDSDTLCRCLARLRDLSAARVPE
jgi:D-threonate/D-erythronate kinase